MEFPEAPKLEWIELDEARKAVTVPMDWFLQIAEYVVDVRAVEAEMAELKKGLYKQEEN